MKIIKNEITDKQDERVEIFALSGNPMVEKIEELFLQRQCEVIGYLGNEGIKLAPEEIELVFCEDNKIFAYVGSVKYLLKMRLYEAEEILGSQFIKINQSALANIRKIERFEVSVGGSLLIKLKCGAKDYVSRRNLKIVKERLGIR